MKRKVKVIIYNKDGSFNSETSLDSSKYDNIGFTKESLDKYITEILIGERRKKEGFYYIIVSDKTFKK